MQRAERESILRSRGSVPEVHRHIYTTYRKLQQISNNNNNEPQNNRTRLALVV